MQKIGIFALLIFLYGMVPSLWAGAVSVPVNNLSSQSINLAQLPHYPALVVISPESNTIQSASQLYTILHQQYPMQTYLVVSPNLPFYRSNEQYQQYLIKNLAPTFHSTVLLDWNGNVAERLFATNSQKPMVLLLEADGTILGRYRYQVAADALAFVTHTFSEHLVSQPTGLWAETTISPAEKSSGSTN